MFLNSINTNALPEGNLSSRNSDTHIRAIHTNPLHYEEFRGLVRRYKTDLAFTAGTKQSTCTLLTGSHTACGLP
jgi:hypothetical protein